MCIFFFNNVIPRLIIIEHKYVYVTTKIVVVARLYNVLQYLEINVKKIHIAPLVILIKIKLGD